MVASLLQMQMAESRYPRVTTALREAVSRVLAFSALHEHLQTGLGDEADVLDLVHRIAHTTCDVFAFQNVAVEVDGASVICPRGVATNLAVFRPRVSSPGPGWLLTGTGRNLLRSNPGTYAGSGPGCSRSV